MIGDQQLVAFFCDDCGTTFWIDSTALVQVDENQFEFAENERGLPGHISCPNCKLKSGVRRESCADVSTGHERRKGKSAGWEAGYKAGFAEAREKLVRHLL